MHRTRVLRHRTARIAGYRIPELITSPIHSGVIKNAKAPHPALVHDFGKPNTFLLMTVRSNSKPATLNARFLDKDGQAFHEVTFQDRELRHQAPR